MNSKSHQKLPLAWEYTTIGEITLPYETIQPKKSPDNEFKYIDIGSIVPILRKLFDIIGVRLTL